jgi:adenylate cyclase
MIRMDDSARERLQRRWLFLGFTLCFALGAAMQYSRPGAWLDGKLLDAQMHTLKRYFPTPARKDVVVVGIDETDIHQFPEPLTLWHQHLGDFLQAVSEGHAAAVGLDIALPERSFDAIVPGYDHALMSGILVARKTMPTVLALTLDAHGKVLEIDRKFQLLAGADGMGYAVFPHDVDGVVRRFDERLAENGANVPTLVGQLARGLGLKPQPGIIDFSAGADFNYLPLRTVLGWSHANDTASLRRHFEGRPVLLGSILPSEDRVPQPVNLAAWENKAAIAPGVLLQAQALRSLLNGGLVRPVPIWAVLALLVAGALWWLAGLKPILATSVFFLWSCLVFAADVWLFRQGWHVPLSGALVSAFCALTGRAGVDASLKLRERRLLQRAFSASVSPSVMKEILAGTLSPQLGGERKFLCILFSDIRGFTTRSESMSPEAAISLLNRYFERVVDLVHAEGGAVVNFMGDGIMAIFGAPKPLANPCASGFAVAKAMQREVTKFNEVIALEGLAPIEIGVGLHAGDAVVGNMGAAIRNDYTAIGDAPNVASRVEGLTKTVGYRVVCTDTVAEALGSREASVPEDLIPLGPQAIKGHTPVNVYGWGKL